MRMLHTLLIRFCLLFLPEGTLIVGALCKMMDGSPGLFVVSTARNQFGRTTVFIQAQGQIHFCNSRLTQATRVRLEGGEIFLDTPGEQRVELNLNDTYFLSQSVRRLLRSKGVQFL